MILTYNQIIKEFNDFADAHRQIESFGNGNLWEAVEHNQLADFNYPLLWVVDSPATLGEGVFTWNFSILAMSIIEKNESNENEVKSDMAQVLMDMIAYFEQRTATTNNVDWLKVNIQKSGTMTSFTERFEDDLTGWSCGVSFTMPFNYDNCNLPIT